VAKSVLLWATDVPITPILSILPIEKSVGFNLTHYLLGKDLFTGNGPGLK
jgi:hypothetical protein